MKKSKVTSGFAGSIMNVSVTFTFEFMSSDMAQQVIAGLDFGKGRKITSSSDKDGNGGELRVWMNKVSVGCSPCAVTVQVQYERSNHLPIDEQALSICETDAEDFVFKPLDEAFKGHDVVGNHIETPPASPPAPPAPAPAPAPRHSRGRRGR